jgi:hypothetical protein
VGYERNPKVYHLKFQDGEYAGLEVQVRSLTMKQLLIIRTGKGDEGKDGTETAVRFLAERIIGWNLTDQGVPVPPTLDAILDEDDDFILAIINKWTTAVSGVENTPLPESSPSGEPSPEASIPMAPLSESLAS